MTEGTIVFSKAGRDKGRAMVVLHSEGEYLFLADGDLRPIENPKKKKTKHIQPTHTIINLQPKDGRDLQNADIRKEVKFFVQRRCN